MATTITINILTDHTFISHIDHLYSYFFAVMLQPLFKMMGWVDSVLIVGFDALNITGKLPALSKI
jgi:hypothetical protein